MKRERRLDFSMALQDILTDIQARVKELQHVRAEKILITCGQARKKSRATTRPYAFAETGTRRSEMGKLYKPIVVYKKKRMRYEITLRPLFFMRSTPEQRLRTIFHELYHMSPQFDGTLDRARRHDVLPRSEYDQQIGPIVRRYARVMPDWILDVLGVEGEVLVLQWLERPPNRYRPGQKQKRRYTDKDLFLGPVRIVTQR